MSWLKLFGKVENSKASDVNRKVKETPEQIIERITIITEDDEDDENFQHKPLTLEKQSKFFPDDEDDYTLIDENGKELGYSFTKNDIIKALKENNNNVKKAFHDLIEKLRAEIKERNIQMEILRLKAIEQRKLIREEAEKRLYGKINKKKRESISEADKEIIFNKFGNKCAICNITEGLHIHHKDYNPSNNKLDNLIVLCGICHKKIHMKVR